MDCNSCGYAELVRDRRLKHCPECGSTDIVFESDSMAEDRAIDATKVAVRTAESIAVPKAAPKAVPMAPSQPIQPVRRVQPIQVPKLGDVKVNQSKLPTRGLRARILLYGIILLIGGIFLTSFVSYFGRYTSCSYSDIMCTRRLKTPGELFADLAFWVFLIILGILMIIGWSLSHSSYFQDSLRDWRERQQQRLPRE